MAADSNSPNKRIKLMADCEEEDGGDAASFTARDVLEVIRVVKQTIRKLTRINAAIRMVLNEINNIIINNESMGLYPLILDPHMNPHGERAPVLEDDSNWRSVHALIEHTRLVHLTDQDLHRLHRDLRTVITELKRVNEINDHLLEAIVIMAIQINVILEINPLADL